MTNFIQRTLFVLSIALMTIVSCKKEDEQPQDVQPMQSGPLFIGDTDPTFESPLGIAGDPSVVRNGDSLLLYYSAENFKIAVVISTDDGETWQFPDGNTEDDYAALRGQAEGWDATLETNDVLKVGTEYWMYYTGYREGEGESDNDYVSNYEVGLAISQNGIDFTRHPASVEGPIMRRDTSNAHTNDRHAMTSPGVVYQDGMFYMTYAGWNVTDDWTGSNAGIRILGATSLDGLSWVKIDQPIIQPEEVTYNPDINESSLIRSDDGYWYIPFSTDVSIGLARSTNFEGPYEIYPSAIINPDEDWATEVTAPDGLIENGKMRLWYHGVSAPIYFPWVTAEAVADYPLDW